MPAKKYYSANSLKWEKRYLREKCKRLESEMENRYHYLTEHFGSLAIHTVLPEKGDKVTSVTDKIKSAAEKILGRSGREQNFLQSMIRNAFKIFLARKMSGLIMGRIFKRKKRKKEKE